jgi:hypothetical protein
MAQSDIDPITRRTSNSWKTMMTVFFGADGITFLDILPEK